MSDSNEKKLLPVVEYMRMPDDNEPYLQGKKCSKCGAIFMDERKHCAKCGARDSLSDYKLSNTGTVYGYSIVRRSYPGIPVPFISVVVDLDGGGTVKANLINIDASGDDTIFAGMKVRLNFEKAPWPDEAGNEYMLFNFEPTLGE